MDIKSKILLGILGVVIVLSVSTSYYRFLVLHDYVIETEIDCDPTYESCFTWECDSESEECTGNPEEDIWYYKLAYRNAKNIPACDLNDETCNQFACPEGGEADCVEILCSQEALNEHGIDTSCTIPEVFLETTKKNIDDENLSDEILPTNTITEDEELSVTTSASEESQLPAPLP
jgi:hypothetical protein